jgi:hypothetical protein
MCLVPLVSAATALTDAAGSGAHREELPLGASHGHRS